MQWGFTLFRFHFWSLWHRTKVIYQFMIFICQILHFGIEAETQFSHFSISQFLPLTDVTFLYIFLKTYIWYISLLANICRANRYCLSLVTFYKMLNFQIWIRKKVPCLDLPMMLCSILRRDCFFLSNVSVRASCASLYGAVSYLNKLYTPHCVSLYCLCVSPCLML